MADLDPFDQAPDAPARPGRRDRIRFLVCAILLALAHVGLTQYFVPLRVILRPVPIHGVDFDLHIGQVYRVVEGLRGWGKSWVYDVRLLAGQPEGAITDAGSKAWELWTYLWNVCGVDLAIAFNSWVLLVMLACPLLIFGAARCFELSTAASLGAAGMASALWFFDSFIHWVWFVGMVSWAFASCLSALTLGLFYLFLRRRKTWMGALFGVSLALGHLIHPYTFFVLAPPIAALYLREIRALDLRAHLIVAAACAFTLGLNAYWLVVSARHWTYILDSAFYAQGRPSYLWFDFLGVLRAGQDTGVIGVRSGFRFLSLALAIGGLVTWRTARDPRALPMAVAVVGLFGFAYLGSTLRLFAQMQPYRTLVAATLLSTIPAAAFVSSQMRETAIAIASQSSKLLVASGTLLVVQHLAQDALYFVPRILPETENFPDGSPSPLTKYGFLTRLDGPSHVTYSLPHDPYIEPAYEPLIRWLERNVHKGARVLIQHGVLGERVAWRTRLEVMGGFPERNVAHAYANYFRRYREAPPQEELATYLRTYAIDYVVAGERPEFDQSPALRLVHVVGPHRIYRTTRPTGRLLSSRGIVTARTNRIDVTNSDPRVPLVLSYHFHPALRCRPNCRIEREVGTMDQVGLIRIPAPHPASFQIFNSYE